MGLSSNMGEANRTRIALVVFSVGLVLVFSAIALYVLRDKPIDPDEIPVKVASDPDRNLILRLAKAIVFYGTLMFLVFTVAAYAIRRATKHYRARLERPIPHPSPSDDIWAQHRAPPVDEDLESTED